MSADGKEVTEYDTPGELLIRSPSVVLGYLNNEKATKETFQNGWMHTGDEAVIRPSPSKEEHVFIVDRIKELIKVKVCIRFIEYGPSEDQWLITFPGTASRAGGAGSSPSPASRGVRLHSDCRSR